MNSSQSTNAAIIEISQRRSKTITSIAINAIEEMIVSGEIKAGDRINESLIAKRLNISRGPIREACRSLEQAGLLASKTNRGMCVREVSTDEARELYELRGAIAGLAGELIVKRADNKEIQKLKELVNLMQKAAEKDNTQKYYKLNLKFHNKLINATKNNALKDAYNKIVNQLHLLRRQGLVQKGNLKISNQEHRNIVRELEKRDKKKAAKAMQKHIANGFTRLIDSL